MEELADIHSYCIALVSYFRVEQQLRMRGIPYLHVGSITSRSAPPAKLRRASAAASAGPQKDARDDGLFDDDEEVDSGLASADHAADKDEDNAGLQTEESGVAALVPTLCLRATDLLGPAKAHLTKPNVSMRVCNWDDSDRSCVQALIKLRMKSRRFRALHEVVSYASTSDQFSTSPATWIDFDDETSLLTLSTRNLDNCIPIFYTQWERVMRMVQLTREVLNASRAWQQRALRSRISCKKPAELVELRRFDFDMVVFSYGTIKAEDTERKLLVRVRWQDPKMEMAPFTNMPMTQNGGYVIEFGSIPTSDVEAMDKAGTSPHADDVSSTLKADALSEWFDDPHAAANPHNTMAFELRRTVNIAARSAAIASMTHPHLERLVWKGFFKLLQDTLPLVRQVAPLASKCLTDPEVPEVEIKGATWFRLRFQDRYALDIRLATRSRLVISDAAGSLFRTGGQASEPVTAESEAALGIFGGSDLLNSLIAGKVEAADIGSRKRKRPTFDSPTTFSAAGGAAQFQPIPNIESLLSTISAPTSADGEHQQQQQQEQGVRDLRRALLISLTPSHSGSGGAAQVVDKVLPRLIQMVSDEVAKVGTNSSGP